MGRCVLGSPAQRGSDPDALSGLQGEIAELRTALAERQPDGRVENLTQDLAALRAEIATLQGQGGSNDAIQALNAKVSEIDGRLSAVGQSADAVTADDLKSVSDRVDAVDQASREAGSRPAPSGSASTRWKAA